jgi:diacylglycerol kinase (ATP)
MKHAWLIGNPNAGQGRHRAELDASLAARPHVTYRDTESADAVGDLVREACGACADRLVVFGGDGTVHSAARAIIDAKAAGVTAPALSILPGGSANDFARGIGLPDVATASEAFDDGVPINVDAIDVRAAGGVSHVVLNAVSGGIGGEIREAMSDELKAWWGRFSYARLAATIAPTIEPYRATVTVDGTRHRAEATAVLVMNGPSVGGTTLLPVARPDDGWIDFAIITASGMAEIVTLLAQFLAGTLLAGEHLHHVRARSVQIESTPPMPFIGDGEPIGDSPLTFKLIPGAVRVLVPRKTEN